MATYSSPAGIPRPVNDAAIKRALQRLASPLSIFVASGAGHHAGSAAAPTFRALANTDLVGATIALFTGTQTVTVANTVTETSLMPTGQGSLTLPAAYLTAGKTVRFRCKGFWSTKAVGPGNITFN